MSPTYCFLVKDTPYFGYSEVDVFLQAFTVAAEVTDKNISFSMHRNVDNTTINYSVLYSLQYTPDEALNDIIKYSANKFGTMFKAF